MAVIGAGISGVGAAILAKHQGFHVFVSDFGKISADNKSLLDKYQIEWEEGQHSLSRIMEASFVVKSPGISDKTPVIAALKDANIKVISEIEFAANYTKARLICITGSNGKTTTTKLTYHILKNAGLNVGIAGNVGESFALQVATEKFDFYVLEISSFQLDNCYDFKPDTVILTNITPDHLDRYEYSFEKYAQAKFRIIQNLTSNDNIIYNADDEIITELLHKSGTKAKLFPFSQKRKIDGDGAWIEDNTIIININKTKILMTLEQLALQGKHNVYNTMAGGIAARLESIRKETIKQSLFDFDQIEHRMERVNAVRGVTFINDSKATNVNSAWYALETIKEPVVWIVGGVDKGNDYSSLIPSVQEKVKAIVCLGLDNEKIINIFSPFVETIIETAQMNDAVEKAFYLGTPGDVVLLSPACASFDLFENFEDRGNQFKRAVQDL